MIEKISVDPFISTHMIKNDELSSFEFKPIKKYENRLNLNAIDLIKNLYDMGK